MARPSSAVPAIQNNLAVVLWESALLGGEGKGAPPIGSRHRDGARSGAREGAWPEDKHPAHPPRKPAEIGSGWGSIGQPISPRCLWTEGRPSETADWLRCCVGRGLGPSYTAHTHWTGCKPGSEAPPAIGLEKRRLKISMEILSEEREGSVSIVRESKENVSLKSSP